MSWIAFADDRSLTDILLRDALTPQHSSRLNSSMRFVWLTIYFLGLGWSAIHPHDYFTWLLEASPALLGVHFGSHSKTVSFNGTGLHAHSHSLHDSLYRCALHLRPGRYIQIHSRLLRLAEKQLR